LLDGAGFAGGLTDEGLDQGEHFLLRRHGESGFQNCFRGAVGC
jgi:hypothetical protein